MHGDAIRTATESWGGAPPDWVIALAGECDARGSQVQVGRALGYSGATVNQILRNRYAADPSKIETTVRGAIMAETHPCPAVGGDPVRRDRCLREQARKDCATPLRARFFRACRAGCPHSRLTKGGQRC